jgi:hypothetical protein
MTKRLYESAQTVVYDPVASIERNKGRHCIRDFEGGADTLARYARGLSQESPT